MFKYLEIDVKCISHITQKNKFVFPHDSGITSTLKLVSQIILNVFSTNIRNHKLTIVFKTQSHTSFNSLNTIIVCV